MSMFSSVASLPCVADFFPPTPEAYSVLISGFQYFPVLSILQWILSYHPAGKTSVKNSLLNFPGRLAWFMMEIVSPLNLLFILYKLPPMVNIASLPPWNKLAASLFVLHYFNRAIISPWFSAPSMSPIHFLVASFAMIFNWFNSSIIAAWLVGYHVPVVQGYKTDGAPAGPSVASALHGHPPPPVSVRILPVLGVALFVIGMAGNIYSERMFFRLRREEADKRSVAKHKKDDSKAEGNKYSKVYVIPPSQGVFYSILYPHYVFEWIEWLGFALVGTAVFPSRQHTITSTYVTPPVNLAPWLIPTAWLAERLGVPLPLPAVIFVVNAVANMLPHARWGRKWYVEKFGERAVAGRGAAVPFCPWL